MEYLTRLQIQLPGNKCWFMVLPNTVNVSLTRCGPNVSFMFSRNCSGIEAGLERRLAYRELQKTNVDISPKLVPDLLELAHFVKSHCLM